MEEENQSNSINGIQEIFVSVKRIEFLLEEIIFQQIIPRTKDVKEANGKLKIALDNVSDRMKDYVQMILKVDPALKKD